jgi:hypothetical protein
MQGETSRQLPSRVRDSFLGPNSVWQGLIAKICGRAFSRDDGDPGTGFCGAKYDIRICSKYTFNYFRIPFLLFRLRKTNAGMHEAENGDIGALRAA